VGETEWVLEIAKRSISERYGKTAVAAGIVGFADLTLGANIKPVLEAHIKAGGSNFRGIRHPVAKDANPKIWSYKNPPLGLMLDSKFQEGFACLETYGLSFDAWLYHPQIMELVELAKSFPGVSIILDHIGGPLARGTYADKRDEVFKEWQRGIIALAECSNVTVKLGGLGMPSYGFGWNKRPKTPGSVELADAMAPYFNWCIEQFGVDRCMFESNFPVDKVSYSYSAMLNAFKRLSKDFSAKEKAALFYDTAVNVYRLGDTALN
jgi:predicted TIM-barrel fold metal-dependent hydrolase